MPRFTVAGVFAAVDRVSAEAEARTAGMRRAAKILSAMIRHAVHGRRMFLAREENERRWDELDRRDVAMEEHARRRMG